MAPELPLPRFQGPGGQIKLTIIIIIIIIILIREGDARSRIHVLIFILWLPEETESVFRGRRTTVKYCGGGLSSCSL